MKRIILMAACVFLSLQAHAIEIRTLGLVPIDPINDYWIDNSKILYIPWFRQNELRVFDLASWQDKEFLHEDNINTWRLDNIFNTVYAQNEQYISISYLRENSWQAQGAIIATRKAKLFPVPINYQLLSEKMEEYYISTEDDYVGFSVLDVPTNIFTDYQIPFFEFHGIDTQKERLNPLKFQDYDPETGKVTISYKHRYFVNSYTHYTANIIGGKLENIKLMFVDDSGEPRYGYSNQIWILKNGLCLAAKYTHTIKTGNDSYNYATLIIVDSEGKEIYEYPDFLLRMDDENFFRLSPDRTKILLWGTYLKDDKPGEATYMLEIDYD